MALEPTLNCALKLIWVFVRKFPPLDWVFNWTLGAWLVIYCNYICSLQIIFTLNTAFSCFFSFLGMIFLLTPKILQNICYIYDKRGLAIYFLIFYACYDIYSQKVLFNIYWLCFVYFCMFCIKNVDLYQTNYSY